MTQKATRVRCTDEKFLEAVYSSKTYAEISEKTGQKIASTIARYGRIKKTLAENGVDLPEMERKKHERKNNKVNDIIKVAQRLRSYHQNM